MQGKNIWRLCKYSGAGVGTIADRQRAREAVPFYRESEAGHRALPLAPPVRPNRTRQTHGRAEYQRGAVLRAARRNDGRPARVDDRCRRVRGPDHRSAGRLDRGAPGARGVAGRRRASRARPHPCVNALEGGLRCATCVRRAPPRSRCSLPPPTSTYAFAFRSMRTLRFLLIARAGRLARIDGRQVLCLTQNPATEALYDRVAHALVA
jgi:hypothetical protein